MISDLSTLLSKNPPDFDGTPPAIPQGMSRHEYVHLGKHTHLQLAGSPGDYVEGVYISSSEPSGGDTALTLVAVCRRGGSLKPSDKLEKYFISQTAMVFTSYVGGKFTVIEGDETLVGDPAVSLANMIALLQYTGTLERPDLDKPLPGPDHWVVRLDDRSPLH